MRNKKHLFISTSGEILPRWKQAFAKASGVQSSQLPNTTPAEFVWLRLQQDVSATQQIQTALQSIDKGALIVLSDLPNNEEGMEAFAASARGYCNTHATSQVLKQVASVIDQGGLWIGESLMARLLSGIQQIQPSATGLTSSEPKAKPDWHDKLSSREMEVGKAIAAGASNKEVARQLNITERTVKAHVSSLFSKLNVQDRLQLALKIRTL